MLNAASMQRLSRKTLFDSSSHIYFVGGSCFIYVICIYLRIMVSNTISISYYVRVV